MYKVDNLLADAARHRTALTRRGSDDVLQAWDAFNSYVTSVMEKRQTLSISNFGKIGWKVEEGIHMKPKMRPHFNISEAFARTCNADSYSQLQCPTKNLALIEEFNFSKAAIRFSQSLSKDLIFMSLRAIIAQLAEAISSGQEVSIEMEVGTLHSSARIVQFHFMAEWYLEEGLEVPKSSSHMQGHRPSASFAPPTKDALSLSLQGSNQMKPTTKAIDHGGWAELDDENHSGAGHATGANGLSKEEQAQREALERHIHEISGLAANVIKEQDVWEGHIKRCVEEERKDQKWRHDLGIDYADILKDQIRQADDRKAAGRRHAIEQASMHDYPDFSKAPEISVHEYIQERKMNLKEDLDQQVELKRRLKQVAKERDIALDNFSTEASHKDINTSRFEQQIKKDQQKQVLAESWDSGKRIKEVRKAIHDYSKQAPQTRTGLSDMVSSLNGKQGTEKLLAASPRHPAVNFGVGLGMPATPREGDRFFASPREGDRPTTGSSTRPATGSQRRFPIGAAASLALHKQRLADRGMM